MMELYLLNLFFPLIQNTLFSKNNSDIINFSFWTDLLLMTIHIYCTGNISHPDLTKFQKVLYHNGLLLLRILLQVTPMNVLFITTITYLP